MKTAKRHPLHRTHLPTQINVRPDVEYRAREKRLIHRMARNSPSENRRLGKEISRQRHRLRNSLSLVRRYARQIACLSLTEQQAIRQLQDSPFYVGLGSASALLTDSSDETYEIGELNWLFDDEEVDDDA